jgi:hypothetical protein
VDLEAFDLLTRRTEIMISGSGRALIFVSDRIEVIISGSGEVKMKGGARIDRLETSGSGRLVRVD